MEPFTATVAATLAAATAGTLAYGALARPAPAPGAAANRAWRLAAAAACGWYLSVLLTAAAAAFAVPPAVARALLVPGAVAWLAAYPAAAAGAAVAAEARRLAAPLAVATVAPAAPLLAATAGPLGAGAGLPQLLSAAGPWPGVHAATGSAACALLAARAARRTRTRGGRRLLTGLALAVAAVGAAALRLVFLSPPAARHGLLPPALHLPGLLPAATVLALGYRDAGLRVGVPPRSLRHGLTGLLLLGAVGGGATLVNGSGPATSRLLAATALAVVAAASLYTPAKRAALRRLPWLIPLAEPRVSAAEAAELARDAALPLPPQELERRFRERLAALLGPAARWIPRRPRAGPLLELWDRLAARPAGPPLELEGAVPDEAGLLAAAGAVAAIPLRVGRELRAVLLVRGGRPLREGEAVALALAAERLGAALALAASAEARLEAQRRALESERLALLGGVAAAVAHEVRNPLGSMLALVETAREEVAAAGCAAGAVADLELVAEQIRRLEQVAREILGFARPPEAARTDLDELVRGALRLAGVEARRRGVALDASGVARVGAAPGSPALWQIVVFNLLINALRHAPEGSTARVRLARRVGELVLATSNPAPELPAHPDELRRRFVSQDGTGLGLALVEERVGALGGALAIEHRQGHLEVTVRVPLPAARGEDEVR